MVPVQQEGGWTVPALGYCDRVRNKKHRAIHAQRKDCKNWREWKDLPAFFDEDTEFAMLDGAVQR